MATILIVDDDAAVRDSLAAALADLGHMPLEADVGQAALACLREKSIDAVLLDLRTPGLDGLEILRHIRLLPGPPPVAALTEVAATNAIEARRLGAVDHLTKPVRHEALAALLGRILPCTPSEVSSERQIGSAEIVGASAAMRAVQRTIGMVADSDAPILILGDPGTGKNVVAHTIHRHGRRSDKPFVTVNCAAIPGEPLETRLFGHMREAFTGAVSNHLGSFREADGGTLFLDQIGDMSLAVQSKLLGVLQKRVVRPPGGNPVTIDVRIIAATHHDLERAVTQGRFREDLFYWRDLVSVYLPPLRERLADILPLAEHFLALAAVRRPPKHLSAEAARCLLAHDWPGNVRELRDAVERAAGLVRHPVLNAADFDFLTRRQTERELDWLAGDLPTALARVETAVIRRALADCGGNRTEAAHRLNINRQLLYAKMRRYGLDVPETGTGAVPNTASAPGQQE
jgi:DNA-binding NtrC family response regulator